jgi:8-oxo-dGTP diphosphatase
MTPAAEPYKFLSPWIHSANSLSPPVQVVSCFIRCENKILVLQRAKKDQQHMLWGIPGGKLNIDEIPINGLAREIYEETGINLIPDFFKFLGKALSKTSCDGIYGLYIYYIQIQKKPEIKINLHEHYLYKWVTLSEFESLNLLTAQYEAYRFVKKSLKRRWSA